MSITASRTFTILSDLQSGTRDVVDASLCAEFEAALRAILADPYGCPFCDSGKLRNPTKEHDEACGYCLAAEALNPLPREEP